MFPLHHSDATPEDANALQRFNDSEFGTFFGNVLHSAGALLFAAGIILYLYVAHHLRHAKDVDARPNPTLLGYAHASTLVGILLNGVGGLMRLYQSDHPGLERLADSTWVQVLLVKHLFLVAGIGLAIWLSWKARRLEMLEEPPARPAREGRTMAGLALGSAATILLATLLGAVAANVDLVEDLGRPPLTQGPGPSPPPPEPTRRVLNQYAPPPDAISGTPVAPGSRDHGFFVPHGARELVVLLSWTTTLAELDLVLEDPEGTLVEGERTAEAASLRVHVAGDTLPNGTWTIQVRATRAAQESYRLTATAFGFEVENLIERTVEILGGAFFEANLNMPTGANLSFDWRVEGSDVVVHFDIHRHRPDGEIEYPVTGDWNRLSGNYRHPGPEPGASLLWENNGTTRVTVKLLVWGAFAVDSYAPAAA